MNKIAKYSNTLFNIVNQNNLLTKTTLQLKKIKSLYKTEPNFRLLVESKRIATDTKKTILKNVLDVFEDVVVEFLCILIEQKSSKYLIQIIDKFLKLSSIEQNKNELEIIAANQLSDDVIDQISKQLNCMIKVSIDQSIIGGIKLRKGNKIFDNSISFQLNSLKKTLYNV